MATETSDGVDASKWPQVQEYRCSLDAEKGKKGDSTSAPAEGIPMYPL